MFKPISAKEIKRRLPHPPTFTRVTVGGGQRHLRPLARDIELNAKQINLMLMEGIEAVLAEQPKNRLEFRNAKWNDAITSEPIELPVATVPLLAFRNTQWAKTVEAIAKPDLTPLPAVKHGPRFKQKTKRK